MTMKKYVRDIRDRDQVESVFLVKDKITAMAKNGKPYLTLRLMDKTGEIEARIWDNADAVSAMFDRDDFVSIRSKASVYLGKMQLIVSEIRKMPDADVALADYLPEAGRPVAGMVEELHALVASLENPHLKGLMEAFLADSDFARLYTTAPAAKGMHHVYLGGLLEHSLSVARLVDSIVPLYGCMDRDLLVTGALLHDAGKVREMTYSRSFDYTDEGKLLGHITIGVEMVTEKLMGLPGFPVELVMLLKHMILSHHGQYEYGSPKRPKTLEATILNYLDDLDSKINGIRSHMDKEIGENRWTAYHRLYDRYFYRGEVSSAAPASAAEPPAPVDPAPRERQERQKFSNSPFDALKSTTLDLFQEEK